MPIPNVEVFFGRRAGRMGRALKPTGPSALQIGCDCIAGAPRCHMDGGKIGAHGPQQYALELSRGTLSEIYLS